ncbi:hypothetical protein [Geodermatophilus sp. URMC 64]
MGAALALVLVFAAVRLTSSPAPPPGRIDADPTPVVTDRGTDAFDLDTRGSLAGDEGWLADVASLDSLAALPAQRHVAFAGDVPEERIALVLARADGQAVAAWLTGPADAGPEEMTPAVAPYPVDPAEPLVLWDVPEPAWTGGLLVVVAGPDDELAFVSGRFVDTSGEESEVHVRLTARDGVVLTPVGPPVASVGGGRSEGWVVATRAAGTSVVSPVLSARAQAVAEAPVEPADPRGLRGQADEDQLQALLHEMIGTYGLTADQVSPVLLVAGRVGEAGDAALLVGATLPSGATVAWLSVAGTGPGSPLARTVATTPEPAGTPLLERVVAVPAGWATSRIPLPPADVPPGWLVVSGPRDGVTAETYNAGQRVLSSLPLVAGAGIAPVPQGTVYVGVRDGAGKILAGGRVARLAG